MNEALMLYEALNIFPKSPYSLEVCISGVMRLYLMPRDVTDANRIQWLLKHGGLDHPDAKRIHSMLTA